jgi:hypothetical protein
MSFDATTQVALDNFDLVNYVQRDGVALHREGNAYKGLCPLPSHVEHTASFTVWPTTGPKRGWYCFGCCQGGSALDYVILRAGRDRHDADAICEGLAALGIGEGRRLTLPPLPRRTVQARSTGPRLPQRAPDAIHRYLDAAGQERYQVRRWNLTPNESARYGGASKLVRPCHPDGQIGLPAGAAPLLYRLPELLAADPADPVWIVEGERCADVLAALGWVVTTNSGGAGHWPAACNAVLTGRTVYILPDNDDAGRHHADLIATPLRAVAAVVKIVELPALPEHGDVADFLATWHPDAVRALAAAAPALASVDLVSGEIADSAPLEAGADALAALQAAYDLVVTERDRLAAELAQERAGRRYLLNWQKVVNVLPGVKAVAPFVGYQYKQRVSACEADKDGWVRISLAGLVDSTSPEPLPPPAERTPEQVTAIRRRAEQYGDYILDMAGLGWLEVRREETPMQDHGTWVARPWKIRVADPAFFENPLALPVPPKRTARPRKLICPQCGAHARQVIFGVCNEGHIFPLPAEDDASLAALPQSRKISDIRMCDQVGDGYPYPLIDRDPMSENFRLRPLLSAAADAAVCPACDEPRPCLCDVAVRDDPVGTRARSIRAPAEVVAYA